MKIINDKFRMAQWLLIALTLYAVAMLLAQAKILPQVQIVTWKLGHETVAAFVGYWIDRAAFRDRLTATSEPQKQIRRALIIAGAMVATALGA